MCIFTTIHAILAKFIQFEKKTIDENLSNGLNDLKVQYDEDTIYIVREPTRI